MELHRGVLFTVPLSFAIAAGCATGTPDSGQLGDGLHLTSGSGGMNTGISKNYGMTVFGGKGDCQNFGCGGGNSCKSQPYYVASSQRYGCGTHLLVTGPNGKSMVVQTSDAGPGAWVEKNAGTPVLDASPAVAQYLFGTQSIGWKDIKNNPGKYMVTAVPTTQPLGPAQPDGGGGMEAGAGSDGGDQGNGADGGNEYAMIRRHEEPKRYTVNLSASSSEEVPFAWHDVSGMAPPADLWVQAQGRTVLQIASIADRPFVRSGLDVYPIVPDVDYRLLIKSDRSVTSLTVEGPDHEVVFGSNVAASFSVDVLLPGAPYRRSVESMRIQ